MTVHVKSGRCSVDATDCREIVYTLFLDRVDRDDGMAGLDQRFEIVRRVGVRHVREGRLRQTR